MADRELQHFTFGNGASSFGQDAQTIERSGFHHHLESLAEQIITHQHTRLIAPDHPCRLFAAAQIAFIDHIIMQQCGGVHKLHTHGQFQMVQPGITTHAGGGHSEHGANALAARIDEMAGKFGNQLHMALGFFHNEFIHQSHIGAG